MSELLSSAHMILLIPLPLPLSILSASQISQGFYSLHPPTILRKKGTDLFTGPATRAIQYNNQYPKIPD